MRCLLIFAVIVCATIMTGCSLTAMIVPVEGPLSLLNPVPTFNIKAEGIGHGGGKLILSNFSGAVCNGRWAVASHGPMIGVSNANLISQYGATYLSGFSVASDSSISHGQGILTCQDGRTIQAEFTASGNSNHGFGIAKDNQQNVFKLLF